MLVFTPQGRLAFVASQSRDLSRVLVFETFSEETVRTNDLRSLRPAGAGA